ncbi:hypothetical protein M9Y10_032516 [Tritrichomonas musculus]|uniref:F5/8 type C domain-containing protein n=1 Tax=Tritrichomonas musculus TaxID=1915356 RepID=A0ABR2GYP7_9EUKA
MSERKVNYSLSTENVKTVPFAKYEKNFTFIVNGKRYETSRFIADILSPIICNYHYEDETIDEFTINTTSRGQTQTDNDDSFQEFLQIINFNEIELEASQRKKFGEYFLQIGNIEEYLRLCPEYFDDLSPENVIDRLKFTTETMKTYRKGTDSLKLTGKINNLIEFAAENFFQIPRENMKTVEIEILAAIIKNAKLRLDDEESLFELILGLYEEDREYSSLFEYVEFKHLKSESVREFIDQFDIEYLSRGTWQSICERLAGVCETPGESERYILKYEEFPHKEGEEFKGIMRHLTDETGGNIHDNGTIEITSNSVYSNYYPRNIVDFQSSNYYETNDQENSEICFDFKDREIQITSYSLKTYNYGQSGNHLKSWVVEVSNDNQKWDEIDKRENNSTLNGLNFVGTFDTKENKSFYRFVRLRQTGTNWYGNYCTLIVSIEFYGKMKHS